MEFGPYDMVMDFAFASMLLFISKLLRSRVKFIQNLYLPSALIAGFLGLLGGRYFLDVIPFSGQLATYPFMLIVFLFAGLFIGNKSQASIKKIFTDVGDTFAVNLAMQTLQFGAFMLLGTLILSVVFPGIHPWFGLLLPSGFVGGHGYAAAIGGAFVAGGWEDALTIAQTFATIGLLFGIVGGIICINYAVKKKGTRFVKTMAELPESMRTGLVVEEEREELGKNTVNPMSIDPLAWHFLLILIAMAGGYFATNFLQSVFPGVGIPMMSVAMIAGVLMHFILKLLNLNRYVDKKVITRIGSASTDYLVVFGVSAIRITVVVEFAGPIILLSLLGLLYALWYLFFVSRKLYNRFWFERGIFVYGWATGVVATGVTLLRVVDPEFRSKTLQDYGTAYVLICIVEVFLVSLTPILVMQGQGLVGGGVLMAISAVLLLGCAKIYGVNRRRMDEVSPEELEIINAKEVT